MNNWVHNSWTRWDPIDNPTAESARVEGTYRVPCSVTSLACGPWLLGPICQWLWDGHNCWEFGGDTADVSLQKLKPFCLRHVGPSGITMWVTAHTDQRAEVRLIGVVLWFIMKTLNLYRFLNSCANQLFFCEFLGKCSHSKWIQLRRVYPVQLCTLIEIYLSIAYTKLQHGNEGEVANDIWCLGNPNLYAVFWYCEVHYSMNVRGMMSISSYMHMIIVVEIEGEDEHSKVLVLFKCAS